MELLHFDTEARQASVRMTRTELLDLDTMFLHSDKRQAYVVVRTDFGEVELEVVKD